MRSEMNAPTLKALRRAVLLASELEVPRGHFYRWASLLLGKPLVDKEDLCTLSEEEAKTLEDVLEFFHNLVFVEHGGLPPARQGFLDALRLRLGEGKPLTKRDATFVEVCVDAAFDRMVIPPWEVASCWDG